MNDQTNQIRLDYRDSTRAVSSGRSLPIMDAMALTWFQTKGLAQNFWYLSNEASERSIASPRWRHTQAAAQFTVSGGRLVTRLLLLGGSDTAIGCLVCFYWGGQCWLKCLGYQADECICRRGGGIL